VIVYKEVLSPTVNGKEEAYAVALAPTRKMKYPRS